MQNSKRVIVWGLEDLLGWTVDFFLGAKNGWDVLNVSEKEGIDNLIQEVKEKCPEVVVFCKNGSDNDADLLVQLVQSCPGVKVITVNRQDNSVEVFKKQQIWLKEVSDLMAAVNG